MIDTKTQISISWWRTNFTEKDIRRVTEAIASGCVSQGPVVAEFERRLAIALGVPYIVATTSGSVALLMALMAWGIKRDDEVIIPNRTWIATAHAPMMLGAKVVLVDVLPDVPLMDVAQIKKKITTRTKAIMPVCLNGRSVDMEQVWGIAKEYGLTVIEDGAQGLFSKRAGGYIGTGSDAGCFSLSIAKLLPTGQGGFVATKNREIYERLKRIRTHGVDDVITCTFYEMGFNFRFTDIHASLGLGQLDQLEERIANLKKIYSLYEKKLKGLHFLQLIPVDILKGEIPIYIEVLCKKRQSLINFLASHNIQVRPFYPDLDTAPHLKIFDEFPNSRAFSEQGLVLPCGPDQPLENIDYVVQKLELFSKEL